MPTMQNTQWLSLQTSQQMNGSITGLTPSIKFAGTHLYSCTERGTVRVKCFAQLSRTQHSVPGQGSNPDHECTNHEATALRAVIKDK